MGTFVGYFDAAGTENDSDVIVACGALSFLDDWNVFDERQLENMKDAGLPSFHMKEMATFDPIKRTEFLSRLVRNTNESVYRIYVSTLVLKDFQEVNAQYLLEEKLGNPYAWVMMNCLLQAFDWIFNKTADDPSPVVGSGDSAVFFVEKGDTGQDGLRKLMRKLGWAERSPLDNAIQFISKRIGSEDVTPFHVPDFVAYEYRSEHRYFVQHGQEKAKPRGALVAIRDELYPTVGIVTKEELLHACAGNNVPRRQP